MAENAFAEEPWSERIDGKIVMMSPRPSVNHNTIVTNLSRIFGNFLLGKRCRVFSDGVDVHLDEKNIFIPDVMIVCNRDIIHYDGIYGAPDLVVEVLSPSTAGRDFKDKFRAYEKAGVKEYWLVDPASRAIHVYLRQDGHFELDNVYAMHPDWEWAKMTDEEKAAARLSVKVSLYDNLIVSLADVFENIE